MRFSILLCALFFALDGRAAECTAYEPSAGEKISILESTNSLDLYFSAPETVGGSKLVAMYMRGFRDDPLDPSTHYLIPLVFDVNDGVAEASIWMTPGFLYARVEAKYGEDVCGPRIKTYLPRRK